MPARALRGGDRLDARLTPIHFCGIAPAAYIPARVSEAARLGAPPPRHDGTAAGTARTPRLEAWNEAARFSIGDDGMGGMDERGSVRTDRTAPRGWEPGRRQTGFCGDARRGEEGDPGAGACRAEGGSPP